MTPPASSIPSAPRPSGSGRSVSTGVDVEGEVDPVRRLVVERDVEVLGVHQLADDRVDRCDRTRSCRARRWPSRRSAAGWPRSDLSLDRARASAARRSATVRDEGSASSAWRLACPACRLARPWRPSMRSWRLSLPIRSLVGLRLAGSGALAGLAASMRRPRFAAPSACCRVRISASARPSAAVRPVTAAPRSDSAVRDVGRVARAHPDLPAALHQPEHTRAVDGRSTVRAIRPRSCRKWRTPVRTIVAPAASATAIDLRIADRAAGLDERRHAGGQADLDGVREREERIRAAGRADRRVGARDRPRPVDRLARGVDPAGLTRTQPDEPAVLDQHDAVARHAPDETPGEVEVARLVGRRAARGRDRPRRWSVGHAVRSADEDGPAGGPDRPERVGRPVVPGVRIAVERRVDDEAEVGLRGEDLQGRRLEAGRDDDLEEDRREGLRQRAVDRAGEPDDAPERRYGIAGQGAPARRRAASGARRRRTGSCA